MAPKGGFRAAFLGLAAFLFLVGFAGNDAWAQDVYVARGIAIDITGDVSQLRDQAVLAAQREGLRKVLEEIAPAEEVAGLLLPGDDEIGAWVHDFEIEQEKIAANRYIGRFTIRYAVDPVQEFLAGQGISFAETHSKEVLLIPVFTDAMGTASLWGPANPWLTAWTQRLAASGGSAGLVPIVVPSGSFADQAGLSATEALGGDTGKIDLMARRYAAGDSVVAEASLRPPGNDGMLGLDLLVTRYGIEGVERFQDSVVGPADNPDLVLGQGVAIVQAMLSGAWKSANLVDASQRTDLRVHVPLAGLPQWIEVKRRLGKVSALKAISLRELSRGGAELAVTYVGDEAQFIRALAQADLLLVMSGEGMATMTMAGTTNVGPSDGVLPDFTPDPQVQ
jgi:Uncharacterized protein conserved in bacteria (DUF2066)